MAAFAQTAKKAAGSDPGLARAEALWHAHDYEGANAAFKSLVAAHPENPDYRVQWGRLFFERFNPDEAQKLFGEALEIDPNHPGALLGMAEVLAEGYSGKANEFAEKALK